MRIVCFLTYTEIEVKLAMKLSLPLVLDLVIWVGLANGMLADEKKTPQTQSDILTYLPPLTQHKPASLPVKKRMRDVWSGPWLHLQLGGWLAQKSHPLSAAPDNLWTSEQHRNTTVLSWQSWVSGYTASMWQGLVERTTNSIQSVLFSFPTTARLHSVPAFSLVAI